MQMNSMAIIFQLISRCYQDPSGKKTLVTAATHTLKALKQYLIQVSSCFLVVTSKNESAKLVLA
jgi:hypothetical protein